MLKVKIIPAKWGTYQLKLNSYKHRRKIAKYLHSIKVPTYNTTPLYQGELQDLVDLFYLTPTNIKDLSNGWPVVKLIDPHTYLTIVGWDAADNVKL